MFDIAIIGLGPAGATISRLLSQNFKVIALDKNSRQNTGFSKPCGGLLAPDAQKVLSQFNLTLPKSILADPQIFSVRTIDIKTGLLNHYQRFYINLQRFKFDRWLRSLIPSNVKTLYNYRCVKIEHNKDLFYITAVSDNKETVIEARYIVGADGANSIVRHALFPEFKIKKYLSIQQWFKDYHPTPFYSCIFDSDLTNSYCWGLSKDNYFILGGAFNPKNAKLSFEKLKQKIAAFGFNLENPIKTESCPIIKSGRFYNFCHGKKNVFLIGEAAGFISPSSFEGISYALKSAFALSEVLNRNTNNPFKEYKKATRAIRLKIFIKNFKSSVIFCPFLRKLIMKSGIKSIKSHGKY